MGGQAKQGRSRKEEPSRALLPSRWRREKLPRQALFTFYAAERFAYFVECTEALSQQLLTESSKRDSKGTIKGTAATSSETAKLLRNRVLRRLETHAP